MDNRLPQNDSAEFDKFLEASRLFIAEMRVFSGKKRLYDLQYGTMEKLIALRPSQNQLVEMQLMTKELREMEAKTC